MKRRTARIRWEAIDEIQHDLKGDIVYIGGLELLIRQTWVKMCCREDLEPIIKHLNTLRWRIQDRVETYQREIIQRLSRIETRLEDGFKVS